MAHCLGGHSAHIRCAHFTCRRAFTCIRVKGLKYSKRCLNCNLRSSLPLCFRSRTKCLSVFSFPGFSLPYTRCAELGLHPYTKLTSRDMVKTSQNTPADTPEPQIGSRRKADDDDSSGRTTKKARTRVRYALFVLKLCAHLPVSDMVDIFMMMELLPEGTTKLSML